MLLTRSFRDGRSGLELEFWLASGEGPIQVTVTGQRALCFVERAWGLAGDFERKSLKLQSLSGDDVDGLYFKTQAQLRRFVDTQAGDEARLLEADVNPSARYLMERFVCHGVKLVGPAQRRGGVWKFHNPRLTACDYQGMPSLMSLDIETEGLDGALLSVAVISSEGARVFLRRDQGVGDDLLAGELAAERVRPATRIETFATEKSLLEALSSWVVACDPDCLLGWNIVEFDLTYLGDAYHRHGLAFAWGRDPAHRSSRVLPARAPRTPARARIPGRVVLDGIACLRSATYEFEDFKLESVAHKLLGRGKSIDPRSDPVAEIIRMHREQPLALAHYNVLDAQLVLDIFSEARLLDYVCERQRLTGLALDRVGGSVAAFDYLYLPRLHRAGYVAPSVGSRRDSGPAAPGGYVMESTPGLFRNIIILDFKSLYPSIIRSFCIDPLGLAQPGADPVEAEGGASFAREGHLLPQMITDLWSARDAAKRDKNQALSRAIKIIMNSFYGVLGTPGCRFFDTRLVSSITLWGHRILQDTRRQIEAHGLRVIYGDTDSVFVALDEEASPSACFDAGRILAAQLNRYWRDVVSDGYHLQSQLELEFETLYRHFFMPTMRGSDRGSKKRYAGLVWHDDNNTQLVIKGLEAVRSDWTALARSFQRELFRRCFAGEDVHTYVVDLVAQVLAGQHDDELVYRKTLRRPLDSYSASTPPQVRAARILQAQGHPVPRRIAYVMTIQGAQPWPSATPHRLDYEHYLSRQLAPAADAILRCLGTSFEALTGRQLLLF